LGASPGEVVIEVVIEPRPETNNGRCFVSNRPGSFVVSS